MAMISPGGIATCAAASAGFLAWAVRGRAAQVFGRSVWRGPRDRAVISLTFDDGPSESTPRILEILNRYAMPATFFQCGENVERLPQVAREVLAAGHAIGNHSQTHPAFYLRIAVVHRRGTHGAPSGPSSTHTGTRPVVVSRPFWRALVRVAARPAPAGT